MLPSPLELTLTYLDSVMKTEMDAAREAVDQMLYAIKTSDEAVEIEYRSVFIERFNDCKKIVRMRNDLKELVKQNEERIQKKNPRYIEV